MRVNYKYKNRPIAPPEFNTGRSVTRVSDEETTAGVLQGKKASDLEMRFAKSLEKIQGSYDFRVRISSLAAGTKRKLSTAFTNLPGEVEIDFLADHHGRKVPVMIDGQIGHFHAPWQKAVDDEKKNIVDDFGKQYGWEETKRIPFTDLVNQEMTDRLVRQMFA